MANFYIGYQGNKPVRVETPREVIENDIFLKCDRIEEYEGQAQLIDGKILFGEEIQTYLIDKAYKDFDSKVEQRLNDFAATRRYNSIYTAASILTCLLYYDSQVNIPLLLPQWPISI